MDTIKERLENLAKVLGIGLSTMGAQIGLGTSTLLATKTSKNGIPSEYIRLLKERFPEISIEYLVTGEGSVLARNDRPYSKEEEKRKAQLISELDRIQGALHALRQEIEVEYPKKKEE